MTLLLTHTYFVSQLVEAAEISHVEDCNALSCLVLPRLACRAGFPKSNLYRHFTNVEQGVLHTRQTIFPLSTVGGQ